MRAKRLPRGSRPGVVGSLLAAALASCAYSDGSTEVPAGEMVLGPPSVAYSDNCEIFIRPPGVPQVEAPQLVVSYAEDSSPDAFGFTLSFDDSMDEFQIREAGISPTWSDLDPGDIVFTSRAGSADSMILRTSGSIDRFPIDHVSLRITDGSVDVNVEDAVSAEAHRRSPWHGFVVHVQFKNTLKTFEVRGRRP